MKLADINPGTLLVDIAAAAVKKIRNRPKAVARRAAKAAREAAPSPPDEIDEPFFSYDDKETSMFKGKKTYLGIGAIVAGLVLGAIGFGECDPATVADACVSQQAMTDRLMAFVNEALSIGGVILATYGRAQAGK